MVISHYRVTTTTSLATLKGRRSMGGFPWYAYIKYPIRYYIMKYSMNYDMIDHDPNTIILVLDVIVALGASGGLPNFTNLQSVEFPLSDFNSV